MATLTSGMPASTLVDIRTTLPPISNATLPNPNMVLYCTTQQPLDNTALPFKIYIGSDAVRKDYGDDSITYKNALALFSQSPNILDGEGHLVIAPFKPAPNGSINAQPETAQTKDISVAKFATVNNGSIKITVDGVVFDLHHLDFTHVKNIADIALVFQGPLVGTCDVKPIDTNVLRFVSRVVGPVSSIVFASGSPGADLSGPDYLNISGITTIPGEATTFELPSACVDRISALPVRPPFVTVLSDLMLDNVSFETCASYFAGTLSGANPLIWMETFYSILETNAYPASSAQAPSQVVAKQQANVRMLLDLTDTVLTRERMFAYIGRTHSANINTPQSASSCFVSNKTLTGYVGDVVSESLRDAIQASGLDGYYNIAGDSSIYASGANQWHDVVYRDIYIHYYLMQQYLGLLRPNGYIPRNPIGESMLKGTGNQAMQQTSIAGFITSGSQWRGDLPVGIPPAYGTVFRQGIANLGYYVYIPNFVDRPKSESDSREAHGIIIAYMLTNGIQRVFARTFSQLS